MLTECLKVLGMLVMAQGAGKSLDHKLVGVWTTNSAGRQTEITYSADHKYIKKWGREKFITGFYQEKGRWEILSGDRVQWTPDSRKSTVLRTDRKLTNEVKAHEKAMDEGAWKPLPMLIKFTGPDTFSERMAIGKSKESKTYNRAKSAIDPRSPRPPNQEKPLGARTSSSAPGVGTSRPAQTN